jgi:hypothetical protein
MGISDHTRWRFRKKFLPWLAGSKPTEWLAVIAAIVGAVLIYRTGILDAKKTLLEIGNKDLEARQSVLKEQEEGIKKQLADMKTDLDEKTKELSRVRTDLEQSNRILARHSRNAKAIEFFGNYRGSPNTKLSCDLDGDGVSIRPKATGERIVAKDELFGVLFAANNLAKLSGINIERVLLDRTLLEAIFKLNAGAVKLINCGLTDEMLSGLAVPAHILALDLSDNQISTLPSIPHPQMISFLTLEKTNIEDEAASLLVRQLPNVVSLDFSFSKITDKLLEAIIASQPTELGFVGVTHCDVSIDAIKRLIEETSVFGIEITMNRDRAAELQEFLRKLDRNCLIYMGEGDLYSKSGPGHRLLIDKREVRN